MKFSLLERSIKKTFELAGIEIRRVDVPSATPRLFDCPLEALLYSQGGKPSRFNCPVNLSTHCVGLGLGEASWNPFVEMLSQYREDPGLTYQDSILKIYFDSWAPTTAAHAIAGFHDVPKRFHNLPPYQLFLSPWSSLSERDVEEDTIWWNQKDNREHGGEGLSFPGDGWAFFGPVSTAKGELEFNRSVQLFQSIKSNGYDVTCGGVGVTLLKRGSDYRYLIGGGGYHRAAVMRALGFETFPAQFHRNSVVDVADVELWPNVRNGLWAPDQASAYVDHLFDFDGRGWAEEMGFLDRKL